MFSYRFQHNELTEPQEYSHVTYFNDNTTLLAGMSDYYADFE